MKAFGLEQLNKLNQNIATRQKNFLKQIHFFSQYPEFFSNPIERPGIKTSWLAFPVLINENAPFSRRELQIFLEKNKIQTRVVFTGNILKQPMCRGIKKRVTKHGLSRSDAVMERGILLPVHHGMTSEMFERLHSTIDLFLKGF